MDVYERKIWKTREGDEIQIETMSRQHAANTIAMLERNAESIKFQTVINMIRFASGPLGPSGDMACDRFDREIMDVEDANALLWLRDTPLHRALQDRVSGRVGPPEADLGAYTDFPDPFAG